MRVPSSTRHSPCEYHFNLAKNAAKSILFLRQRPKLREWLLTNTFTTTADKFINEQTSFTHHASSSRPRHNNTKQLILTTNRLLIFESIDVEVLFSELVR